VKNKVKDFTLGKPWVPSTTPAKECWATKNRQQHQVQVDLGHQEQADLGHQEEVTGHQEEVMGHQEEVIGHQEEVMDHREQVNLRKSLF